MEYSNEDISSNQKSPEISKDDFESIMLIFKMLKEERDNQFLIKKIEIN